MEIEKILVKVDEEVKKTEEQEKKEKEKTERRITEIKETMEKAKSDKVIITIAEKEGDEKTHLITVSSEGVLVSMNRELNIVIPAGDNDQDIETAVEEIPLKNLLDIIEESEEDNLIVTVKKEQEK